MLVSESSCPFRRLSGLHAMFLSVDTSALAQNYLRLVNAYLQSNFHHVFKCDPPEDSASIMRICKARGTDVVKSGALDCQAGQEDDVDAAEAICRLHEEATSLTQFQLWHCFAVAWQVEMERVDLRSPAGKRRRTTRDPVSSAPVQEGSLLPEGKRFKGARYRPDRRTWTAEMKPPKSKNKVFFGEFKSQHISARAIDAAFHYYGKSHLLNFPDTPWILETRPSPTGVVSEEDELKFEKGQVKWLASIASSLPSSAPGNSDDTKDRAISDTTSFLSCSDSLTNVVHGAQQSQGPLINFLVMSPSAPMIHRDHAHAS